MSVCCSAFGKRFLRFWFLPFNFVLWLAFLVFFSIFLVAMAVVIRHVQSFVRQAILGIRFSWQLAETVIDEVLEEVDAAFGALVER